jgi:hypothetical protein
MSLPNELFHFFLIYLSSCDILQSLYGINRRVNSLVYEFISRSNKHYRKRPYTDTEIYDRNTITCNTAKHGRIRPFTESVTFDLGLYFLLYLPNVIYLQFHSCALADYFKLEYTPNIPLISLFEKIKCIAIFRNCGFEQNLLVKCKRTFKNALITFKNYENV